ncbi:High-affinity nitrate transporter 2.1 [Linnemannia schmuckeri]|uniref:Nitrate/nitrite transporter n=1 Tax=Linnemannia schmuckeri TaxID=64567 RepID=A0A9P5RWT9_9FUNG|nr:High-affinity nitrate transporter 2.1 [Linnemannia schmuckeri]
MTLATKIFPKQILVDEHGKATNIKLFSFARPHMRAMQLSWLSFFIAFTGWFAIPPLMPTIKTDLKLTPSQISDANLTSVSATILARLMIGPLCDRYGPRKAMAGLLLVGAITIGLAGLVSDANGLIVIRFFIGIVGATFVPCQYWASRMFSSNIVGTANAICGGLGNMGAGVSYFLIPLIYNAFALGLPPHQAWRVTFVVPACLCILMAAADYFLGDDCPGDEWKNRDSSLENHDVEKHGLPRTASDCDSIEIEEMDDKKPTDRKETSSNAVKVPDVVEQPSVLVDLLSQLKNPAVLILMIQYGCSFGVELAVDNMIGEFFHSHFGLSQTTSGMLGSIFGLMNLFSRASGGMLADYVNTLTGEGVQGRMLVHFIVFFCQGAFLIGFSFAMGALSSSLVVLVLFSYFVQAGCGTTFSIVPFANPKSMGAVYGLVGAGGSIGSIVFNYIFKVYGINYTDAFRVIGYAALAAALCTLLLKIQGRMLLGLLFKKLNP